MSLAATLAAKAEAAETMLMAWRRAARKPWGLHGLPAITLLHQITGTAMAALGDNDPIEMIAAQRAFDETGL